VALAALCWGPAGGGIGGILMADGWGAFVVSFYRGAIGLLFVLVWMALRPRRSPQAILVVAFAVLVTIPIWPGDADQTVAVLSTPSWPLFAVLGVLGAGLSFIFYIVGLNHTAPAVASILAMVEPATASLFDVVVLNENLVDIQIFGMGLILVTVTALSVNSRARWT